MSKDNGKYQGECDACPGVLKSPIYATSSEVARWCKSHNDRVHNGVEYATWVWTSRR